MSGVMDVSSDLVTSSPAAQGGVGEFSNCGYVNEFAPKQNRWYIWRPVVAYTDVFYRSKALPRGECPRQVWKKQFKYSYSVDYFYIILNKNSEPTTA